MCNCNEGKIYQIGMGCCEPVVAPANQYYTKGRIDEMLDEIKESGCCITEEEVDEKIESAKTEIENEIPSLSGYATEQWVENKGYLTEHQPLKTINNQVISGTGNIVISGDTDLSDYYTKEEVDAKIPSLSGYATEQWVLNKHYITGVDLSDYATFEDLPDLNGYATKTWVNNQNYASYSELIQYVTNLQQQIDSLKSTISGCCSSSGDTIYRWITMTNENDYWCDGTTKKSMEKQQSSTDGINWNDTGSIRSGSTVLEYNCTECGYVPQVGNKLFMTDNTGGTYTLECEEGYNYIHYHGMKNFTYSDGTTSQTITWLSNDQKRSITDVVIGDCVTSVDGQVFSGFTSLTYVTIPTSVKYIHSEGYGAFEGCSSLSSITVPDSVVYIGGATFRNCSNLDNVTIGSGITEISDYVFTGCENLSGITIKAITPPDIIQNTFVYSNNCPIYVPAASVNAYKTASEYWERYANRIQAIP